MSKLITIEVVQGPAGTCLCLGLSGANTSTRIAGPKPWGGGRTVYKFDVELDTLRDAIEDAQQREGGPS